MVVKGIQWKIHFLLKVWVYSNKKLYIVIVIGNISVGKTNIIRRINNLEFQTTKTTIGTEFFLKNIQIKDEKTNKIANIALKIWDTCNNIF